MQIRKRSRLHVTFHGSFASAYGTNRHTVPLTMGFVKLSRRDRESGYSDSVPGTTPGATEKGPIDGLARRFSRQGESVCGTLELKSPMRSSFRYRNAPGGCPFPLLWMALHGRQQGVADHVGRPAVARLALIPCNERTGLTPFPPTRQIRPPLVPHHTRTF